MKTRAAEALGDLRQTRKNMKRTADNASQSSPIRWTSPKRAKVCTPPRTELSAQGFKIPFRSRQKSDGNRTHLSLTSPHNNPRRDNQDRGRFDDDRRHSHGDSSSRGDGSHRQQYKHHPSHHDGFRRENRDGLTPLQQRWLS